MKSRKTVISPWCLSQICTQPMIHNNYPKNSCEQQHGGRNQYLTIFNALQTTEGSFFCFLVLRKSLTPFCWSLPMLLWVILYLILLNVNVPHSKFTKPLQTLKSFPRDRSSRPCNMILPSLCFIWPSLEKKGNFSSLHEG